MALNTHNPMVALQARHAKVLKEEQKKYQGLYAQLKTLLVEDGLTDALLKAKVHDHYMDAAKALHKKRGKLVEDNKGNFRAVIETDLGEVSIEDYIAEWAQTPQGKAFILAERSSGGGPNGDVMHGQKGGANPFTTGNLTEQARLKMANPKEYDRLKAASGLG
jgi:hypothetical protein